MRRAILLLLLSVVLSACALTELATPPAPTLPAPSVTVAAASPAPTVTLDAASPVPPAATSAATTSPTLPATPTLTSVAPTAAATATPASVAPTLAPTAAGDLQLTLARQFDGAGAYEHVRFLTSDALAGRKAGASGADMAADYIAARFQAAGLRGAGDNGTYFQTLSLPFVELAEAPVLRILDSGGGVKREFKHRLEFS